VGMSFIRDMGGRFIPSNVAWYLAWPIVHCTSIGISVPTAFGPSMLVLGVLLVVRFRVKFCTTPRTSLELCQKFIHSLQHLLARRPAMTA
jgi:hypothetical protein